MDRRSFLTTAAVTPLAGSAIAMDVPEDRAAPFLYTLTAPLPGHHLNPRAGDIALIVPGPLSFDACFLLKDGRFASVMLDWGQCGVNTVTPIGGETFMIPVGELQSILVGRVSKIVGLRNDIWEELRWYGALS